MKPINYIDRNSGKMLVEKPPGESFLKFLYHNPFGQLPLNLFVKRKLLSAIYGKLMSRPLSKKRIEPFVKEYNIDMDEAIKSVDEFTSFNDFFYRELKPNSRFVHKGIVSPADGKIIGFNDIGEVSEFFVKGRKFTLSDFLQDEKLASKYEHSSLFLIRLAPNDYHRFHFPYDGKVSNCYKIKGDYFSVSPIAINENFAKVFCENKREYCILSTKDYMDVLISPVGATMVGSIIETFKPNSKVKAGDEMGYFAFGGSSILMLVDKDKIKIDSDILKNTKKGLETSIRMGERIGK